MMDLFQPCPEKYKISLDKKDVEETLFINLSQLLEKTNSRYGYIAQVASKSSLKDFNNPEGFYLSFRILLKKDGDKFVSVLPYGTTRIGIASIYNESLITKEPVFHNSSHVEIFPEVGPLDRFVCIPLIYKDYYVGQLGLGGCPTDYSLAILQEYSFKRTAMAMVLTNDLMEQENETLREEKKIHKAKNLFMANVSHEIRTPLNSIIGMLSILEDTELDDQQMECVSIMRESSYTLLALINDILDISRLEAGKMELKISPVSLDECIEESYTVTGAICESKRLSFRYTIQADVSSVVIADPQRLKQVLVNLLSNAFKFTEKGGVNICVSLATDEEVAESRLMPIEKFEDASPRENIKRDTLLIDPSLCGGWKYVKFAVSDTGIGIKDEDMKNLFTSFHQIDSSTTKKYIGAGLGLSIVSKLCALMRGSVGLISQYKKGSTFYFIIPLQEYKTPPRSGISYDIFKGKTVLIIDDNEQNIMAACRILDKYGIAHRECTSAKRAIIYYINNPIYKFDLGLIDICMPDYDGNQLAESISKSDRRFPMIALSSMGLRTAEISNQFSIVLMKPFKEDQLIKAMHSIFTHEAARSVKKSDSDSSNSAESEKDKKRRPSFPLQLTNTLRLPFRRKVKSINVDTLPSLGINILVAEDNLFNQRVLVKMLNSAGYYNIDIAETGNQVVKLIKENKDIPIKKEHHKFMEKSAYDVIFMDIIMPDVDGVGAALKVNARFVDVRHRPRIIAVTANAMPGDKEKYLNAGMDAYVSKPIENKEKVLEALQRAFAAEPKKPISENNKKSKE
jgi:signal transduction histidine kinase/DNA-binding response OmpR family regulator